MKKIVAISIIILSISSFGARMKDCNMDYDSNKEDEIECDTLFAFTVNLIECCAWTNDSVNIVGTDIYIMQLPKKIMGTDFSNKFHNTIDTSNLWISMGLDTIFSHQHLENQKSENGFLVKECYPKLNIIEYDLLKNRNEENSLDKYPLYYSFPNPLISEDKKCVLIEMDTHCWGLCGYGETYVFMKTKGHWSLLRKKTRWVS